MTCLKDGRRRLPWAVQLRGAAWAQPCSGREPKGVIRNSNVAKCVELPNITKTTSVEGITLAEHENYPLLKARLKGFRHCFGQPPEVRRAFEEAMGIAK